MEAEAQSLFTITSLTFELPSCCFYKCSSIIAVYQIRSSDFLSYSVCRVIMQGNNLCTLK